MHRNQRNVGHLSPQKLHQRRKVMIVKDNLIPWRIKSTLVEGHRDIPSQGHLLGQGRLLVQGRPLTDPQGHLMTDLRGYLMTDPRGCLMTDPQGRLMTDPQGRHMTDPQGHLLFGNQVQNYKKKLKSQKKV